MAKKKQVNSPTWKAAKEYVNEQLATMKKFGSAPQLSREAYEALVRKVVEATK